MNPDVQAECCLIGDIIADPQKVMPEATLRLIPDDFFTPEYRSIYSTCLKLYREDRQIDPVTVCAPLGKEYRKIVYDAYRTTISTANYAAHIGVVADTAKLIRAEQMAGNFLAGLQDADLEQSREDAVNILKAFDGLDVGQSVSAEDGFIQFFGPERSKKDYIRTGLSKLDRYAFISRGDYVIVGGRPSSGKTALTLQMMLTMAEQHRVVYFSLETKPDKIFDRLIAAYAGADFGAIKRGALPESEWGRISQYGDAFSKLRFSVVSAAGWTVEQVKAKAMQERAEIIFIDYLTLLAGQGKTLYEKATNLSLDLHTLSQRCNITVVALSQLNREGKTEPDMTNLRDSGQAEQDADLILLLAGEAGSDHRDLIVCKNKEGQTGKIPLHFDGAHQRFTLIDERTGL